MARNTSTTYTCDRCGLKAAKPGDLRQFTLTEKKLGGEFVADAKTDLCAPCEVEFHAAALSPFFPNDEAEHLHGVVRDSA